jgi:diguanylate cyclase (GGDEF)-like protein
VSLLVVHPDPSGVEAWRAGLVESGFAGSVERVSSLADGLVRLAERPYDLVLLELGTSDARGIEGIGRIRAIDPEVPVVAVADRDDPRIALAALQRGAQDCVTAEDLAGRAAVRILRHAMERQRIVLELHAARQREQYLATHDPLTGLPNRALFYDRLTQALATASRYDKTLAILFLDLDDFKPVNDTLGHTAGDRLLETVARRLGAVVRRSDTVARMGGDEFTLVLSQVGQAADAAKVAESVLTRVAEPVTLGRAERRVRASVGIAVHPGDGALADTLVRNADLAMYHAKRQGGGRYAFFHRRMLRGDVG